MKCPICGSDLKRKPGSSRWYCPNCGWTDTMGAPATASKKITSTNKKKWPWSRTK